MANYSEPHWQGGHWRSCLDCGTSISGDENRKIHDDWHELKSKRQRIPLKDVPVEIRYNAPDIPDPKRVEILAHELAFAFSTPRIGTWKELTIEQQDYWRSRSTDILRALNHE